MPNRREILQIGITATAWPFASRAARAAAGESRGPLPLYRVIFDRRFDESIAFGRRAESLGLQTHEIDGDMTRFWYDDLYHQWKTSPVAIAGLTVHGPMFCFEQLGHDHGLKLVFRAEHRVGPAGVDHELSGPSSMLGASMAVSEARERWPACMADVIAECPSGRAESSSARAVTSVPGRITHAERDALYSWVIAPVTKA